jgi:hypothetical protein
MVRGMRRIRQRFGMPALHAKNMQYNHISSKQLINNEEAQYWQNAIRKNQRRPQAAAELQQNTEMLISLSKNQFSHCVVYASRRALNHKKILSKWRQAFPNYKHERSVVLLSVWRDATSNSTTTQTSVGKKQGELMRAQLMWRRAWSPTTVCTDNPFNPLNTKLV